MSEEQKEKNYLKKVLTRVDESLQAISERINNQLEEINNAKAHLQEHKRDMDHLEKNARRSPCWEMPRWTRKSGSSD